MAFHSLVGQLVSQERWATLLALLAVAAAVGGVTMVGFHRMTSAAGTRHERTKKDPDILSTEHHHKSLSIASSLGGSGGSLGSSSGGGGGGGRGEVGLIPRVLGWLLGGGTAPGERTRKRRLRKDSGAVDDYHPLLDPQLSTFLSSRHLTV